MHCVSKYKVIIQSFEILVNILLSVKLHWLKLFQSYQYKIQICILNISEGNHFQIFTEIGKF